MIDTHCGTPAPRHADVDPLVCIDDSRVYLCPCAPGTHAHLETETWALCLPTAQALEVYAVHVLAEGQGDTDRRWGAYDQYRADVRVSVLAATFMAPAFRGESVPLTEVFEFAVHGPMSKHSDRHIRPTTEDAQDAVDEMVNRLTATGRFVVDIGTYALVPRDPVQ